MQEHKMPEIIHDQQPTHSFDEAARLRRRVDGQHTILKGILDGKLLRNLGGRHGKIGDFLHRCHMACESYRQVLLSGPDELELINAHFFVKGMNQTISLLAETSLDLEPDISECAVGRDASIDPTAVNSLATQHPRHSSPV